MLFEQLWASSRTCECYHAKKERQRKTNEQRLSDWTRFTLSLPPTNSVLQILAFVSFEWEFHSCCVCCAIIRRTRRRIIFIFTYSMSIRNDNIILSTFINDRIERKKIALSECERCALWCDTIAHSINELWALCMASTSILYVFSICVLDL